MYPFKQKPSLLGNTNQSVSFVSNQFRKTGLPQKTEFVQKVSLHGNTKNIAPTLTSNVKSPNMTVDESEIEKNVEAKPPSNNVKKHFKDVMYQFGQEIKNQENRNEILNDAAEKMGDTLFKQLINAQFIDKLDTISMTCIQRFDKYIQNTMQGVLISSILDPSYPLYISVNDQILLNLQKYQRKVTVYTPLNTEANFIQTHKGYPLNIVKEAWTDIEDFLTDDVDLVYLNAQYTGDSAMMVEILRALFMLNTNLSSPAGSKYLCLVSAVKLPLDIQTLLRKISDDVFADFASSVDSDEMMGAFFENKKIISGVYTGGKLSDTFPTINIGSAKSQKDDMEGHNINKDNLVNSLVAKRPYIIGKDDGKLVVLQVSDDQKFAEGRKLITMAKKWSDKDIYNYPLLRFTIGTTTKKTNVYTEFSGMSLSKAKHEKIIYLDDTNYEDIYTPYVAPGNEDEDEEEEDDESPGYDPSPDFEDIDVGDMSTSVAIKKPKKFDHVSLDPLQMLNANIELLGMCGKLYEYLFTV